jgi:hypothetical protein
MLNLNTDQYLIGLPYASVGILTYELRILKFGDEPKSFNFKRVYILNYKIIPDNDKQKKLYHREF